MVKVKICGVTNRDDALMATNLGSDYIGFNFAKESPRKISEKNARDIIADLPQFVQSVGVFMDEEVNSIARTVNRLRLSLVQVHGAETPEYCRQLRETLKRPVIKAIRIAGPADLEAMNAYVGCIDYFLLDAFVADQPGGTGQSFDWTHALDARRFGVPIFLAGGLTHENVSEAVRVAAPFAVDCASGVERLPRRKDFARMTAFIRAARGLK